jgi:RNA polymerase primary sigma factor
LKDRTRTHAATGGRPKRTARGDHAAASTSKRAEARAHSHAQPDVEPTESFQIFLNQAGRYPLLTAAEEIELAKRIERGDLAAKERMINSNLRLVVSNARRYRGLGLPMQDLVQEAMLGLIRAAEKFDWRRGYKFSTYATLWIRQAIQRGLDNTGRPIRLPAHIAQRQRNLNRAEAELRVKLDRDPDDEELAAKLELPVEEVAALRDLTRVTASLDAPVGEGETTLGELQDGESPPPEGEVIERELERDVAAALEELPEREREILRLRFGTGGTPPVSAREIARKLGIGEERVRQLENQALARLARRGSLETWRAAA